MFDEDVVHAATFAVHLVHPSAIGSVYRHLGEGYPPGRCVSLSHDGLPASCKEYVEDMRIAPSIELSTRQQEMLEHFVRSPTSEQRLVQRARIVLAASQGGLSRDLAHELGVDADTVGLWRRRWAAAQERLAVTEQGPRRSDLSRCIAETLVDAPRSGWPGIFTPEPAEKFRRVLMTPDPSE